MTDTPSVFTTPSEKAVEAAVLGAWDASGSGDAAHFGLIAAYPIIVREVMQQCIALVQWEADCGSVGAFRLLSALRALLPDANEEGNDDAE